MIFKADHSLKAGLLTIEGALTIQQAKEFKAALMKAISEADGIELNLEKVTEVDLACLQLICATHRACIKTNKSLTVSDSQDEAFNKTIKAAGYASHKRCKDIDDNNRCLCPSGGKYE